MARDFDVGVPPTIFKDIVFGGIVTTVTDTTHFRVGALLGFGNSYFKSWEILVLWDSGGAGIAPQGEHKTCSAYDSATGALTHTAFTTPLVVGDIVLLLAPSLVADIDWLDGGRLDLLLDAVKTKTDNLPGSPAAVGSAMTLTAAYDAAKTAATQTSVNTIDGIVDAVKLKTDIIGATVALESAGNLAAVKGKTDNLPSDPADQSAVEGAIATAHSTTDGKIDAVDSAARKKQVGKEQVFTKAITSAANAGAVTVATVTTQPMLIESIVLHSDGATTADLTSAAITGGASGVISFLSAVDAAKANIDAQDEQVSWQGSVYLPTGATIIITLVGTEATAVDLNVVIKSRATVDGGYLA